MFFRVAGPQNGNLFDPDDDLFTSRWAVVQGLAEVSEAELVDTTLYLHGPERSCADSSQVSNEVQVELEVADCSGGVDARAVSFVYECLP